MKEGLRLARGLILPVEMVTQTAAILAKRGAGKTHTAVVLTEELLDAGQQVVILDPLDVWFGLRSSIDGKAAGFAITVLGGEHGDLPLEASSGTIVADFVVENRAPIILSMRHFSMADQRRLVTDFCERLYHRKGQDKYRQPLQVVIDEADEFVPQRIQAGQERMFGSVDRLVRRGRASGIGVTLISQRAAVINKDVLTQIEVLICLRTISPQDRKALEAWVEAHDAHDQRQEFMESLASLGIGEAWVWSPGWLDLFKRVQIRERKTFDSSATPKVGERPLEPTASAAVDLEKLRRDLAATIEHAKTEDPRELRKRIAGLEAELRKRAGPVDPAALQRAREEERAAGYAEAIEAMELKKSALRMHVGAAESELARMQKLLEKEPPRPFPSAFSKPAHPVRTSPSRPPENISTRGDRIVNADHRLAIGEKRILAACAQYPRGVTREQLTVLTGYRRSSRDTYLQRLQAKGLVEIGPSITATAEGMAALGPDHDPLPTGVELREYWLRRLPEGERRIFEVLVRAYPQALSRDSLEEPTGYKRSSRDTYIQRLRSRQLVEVEGRGELRASEELFV